MFQITSWHTEAPSCNRKLLSSTTQSFSENFYLLRSCSLYKPGPWSRFLSSDCRKQKTQKSRKFWLLWPFFRPPALSSSQNVFGPLTRVVAVFDFKDRVYKCLRRAQGMKNNGCIWSENNCETSIKILLSSFSWCNGLCNCASPLRSSLKMSDCAKTRCYIIPRAWQAIGNRQ